MKPWIVYAFASMLFAGVTAVIAKKGLDGISADLGNAVRTGFVFVAIVLLSVFSVSTRDWTALKPNNWLWLGASAAATAISWVCYYRAIKVGDVSTVALIDKGSVVVAVLLAFFFLHESVTTAKLVGAVLIVAGLVVVARG